MCWNFLFFFIFDWDVMKFIKLNLFYNFFCWQLHQKKHISLLPTLCLNVLPQLDLLKHFSSSACTKKNPPLLQSLCFVIMHHVYIYLIYLSMFYYKFHIRSIWQIYINRTDILKEYKKGKLYFCPLSNALISFKRCL